MKILGMGGGGRGGFARCTTRFLGAFFSFVTRALSPPVVGDGRQNGKDGRYLHSAPLFFCYPRIGLEFQMVRGSFVQKWFWLFVLCSKSD